VTINIIRILFCLEGRGCKLPHAEAVRLLAVLDLDPLPICDRVSTSSHATSWRRLPDPSPVILI